MFNQTVKQFTHIVLASQVIIFCALYYYSFEGTPKLKKLLPKEVRHFEFEKSRTDVLSANPKLVLLKEESFRWVYGLELQDSKISTVVLYFGKSSNEPLYEIIVNYKDTADMEIDANALLGKPNYKGNEWKFYGKASAPLHAWVYRNKIVYAMPLPGTEWYENGKSTL
jgi:hypothetical protein